MTGMEEDHTNGEAEKDEDEEDENETPSKEEEAPAMEEDEDEAEDKGEEEENEAAAMEEDSVYSGGQDGPSTVFKKIHKVCFCDIHKEETRLCGRDRPITHHCGNTYTCLNALHVVCCKEAGLTGADQGTFFCSRTCQAVWATILKVKTPTKPRWETITDRTKNKVVKAFTKENDVPLTTAMQKLVIFTLMVHVKHREQPLQAFIPKLRAGKFYSRALKAIENHAQPTTKPKLLECINGIWPLDSPPPNQPQEETNKDKSGNPQHNIIGKGAGGSS